MGRLLGIDFGLKRVGVAISDPTNVLAFPLTTVDWEDDDYLMLQIDNLVKEYEVETIVVGYPIGMKGQITKQTKLVDDFIGRLAEHIQIPVKKIDERLSSVEAKRTLQDVGIEVSKNRGEVDKIASAIFLQTYLDKMNKD
ncbi:MAG: Holliday junction resolvase RuvX [Candidatus Marinimicrobia bacterium]|nr:Holliday junction resolvase RuvX [Candidatus Neomarinimicrobiota bacterium]